MSGEPCFQNLFARRIGGADYGKQNRIYKFERIKRAKRETVQTNPQKELLDFGIGENDEMADGRVREAMKREIDNPENRGYADNGIQEYKDEAARFMERTFNVKLDPYSQVLHTIGSKSALSLLPSVLIDPGDVCLMTVPGYPVAGTHARYLGGEVWNLKLEEKNRFLPSLSSIPAEIRSRAKLMVLNYPNSPTGAAAPASFWNEAVAFAREEKVVVVNDAAHILLSYSKPYSFLQTEGALDIGMEIHSMSKGFNMIGWRLGFVAGHERLVSALGDVKDNTDSGQFKAIQKASCVALQNGGIHRGIREKYKRRLNKLVSVLKELGFKARFPEGTYFLYVRAPKYVNGTTCNTAQEAAETLLRNHLVVTVPWDDAGPYLRFSVTYQAPTQKEEDRLMGELKKRLQSAEISF